LVELQKEVQNLQSHQAQESKPKLSENNLGLLTDNLNVNVRSNIQWF